MSKKNNGITLVALIITIIVMLILASVSINMVINGEIFEYAGKAAGGTKNVLKAEEELANEEIQIAGKTYDSVDDYIVSTSGKYAAKIGSTYYKTLQAAFDEVQANGTKTTVELLKNVSENVVVNENKNIVLEMNGKTITDVEQEGTVVVYGNLEVTNGKIIALYGDALANLGNTIINEGVEVNCKKNNSDNVAIYNTDGGNVEIKDGNVKGNCGTIYNFDGTITITGGEIHGGTNDDYYTIHNDSGDIIISGGKIYTDYAGLIENYDSVEIKGSAELYASDTISTCTTHNIANYGTFSVEGGTFNIERQGVSFYNNGGECSLKDADISCSGEGTGLFCENGGKFVIGGSCEVDLTNKKMAMEILESELIIEDGMVLLGHCDNLSMYQIVVHEHSYVLISGGEVDCDNNGFKFLEGSTFEMLGGTVTSQYFGTVIYNDGGEITISDGLISFSSLGGYAIYNASGTVAITGGTIEGDTYGVEVEG